MPFYLVVHKAVESPPAGSIPTYKGLDRSPWQCVDEAYYEGRMSPELVVLRQQSRNREVGNLSVGVVLSEQDAMDLASVCQDPVNTSEILVIEPKGPVPDIDQERLGLSGGLGFDGYIDGYGSIILLGITTRPNLFEEFGGRLNGAGLFGTFVDLSDYLAIYNRVTASGNLEVLEGAGSVWVYDILAIREAKSKGLSSD